MGNVLVVCESTSSGLKTSSLASISFARQAAEKHGGDVVLLVIGSGLSAAAEAAAKYASKVVTVDDAALENFLAETYAPVIADVAKTQGATVVCATATSNGKDVMPRAAVHLDAGMASDISDFVDKDTFRRPILAGNAYSTVQVTTDIICVTVRQSEFSPAEETGNTGTVEAASAGDIDAHGAEFVRLESSKSDRPDLNDADVVIAGGRGMQNGENFAHLEKLADVLGAAMGASRAATDAGYVPADWQIGQTGKIVAPDLYIAVGISGAIQHLAGMKGSKTIVAINKDAEAPIFQVADYGLVAKWEDTLPEFLEEVTKLKASQA